LEKLGKFGEFFSYVVKTVKVYFTSYKSHDPQPGTSLHCGTMISVSHDGSIGCLFTYLPMV